MILLIGMAASALLVVICLLVHYEMLRLISVLVPRLTFLRPRDRIVAVVGGAFVAHTLEVWLFALGYFVLSLMPGIGAFSIVDPTTADRFMVMDAPQGQLENFLYFSVVTFTSLGLGDVIPHGAMRMLAGVEAITGLLLIGWSATFTFLEMKELWPLHEERRRRHKRRPPGPD